MTAMKKLILLCLLSTIYACSHPIEIVGEGDVLSATDTRNCSLEDFQAGTDNCAKNLVMNDYVETYFARPREGWVFLGWEGCGEQYPNCSFNVPAETVNQYWFKTMPSLKAVFTRELAGASNWNEGNWDEIIWQ